MTINVILLLFCVGVLWNIRAGIKELNELKMSEYVQNGVVEAQGEEYKIVFGKKSVCVVDSYKVKNRAERLKIIKAIQNELTAQGLSARSTTSMEGEWLLHNIVYQASGLNRAKDVDLDYQKDKRWYVVIVSEILGVTGF